MKCALNAMPACLPRSSDFMVLLRVSIGSRRKSSPVELEQVEGAKDCRRGPVSANEIEYRKSVPVSDDRLAVDEAWACRECSDRRGSYRETPGEIVAVAGKEPHTGSVAPCHDAEAVMFDFMQPVPPDRRPIGRAGEAGLNDAS
jgi:hypothetical protein